jgi:arsenate reductase
MPDTVGGNDIDALLTRISEEMAVGFRGTFGAETVERYVFESYLALHRTAVIKTYVPVIAERFAKERLTALAQAKGAIGKFVPEVLFVCVHNAGRSQMAAALLDRAAAGRVHVRSAGSMPAGQIDRVVLQAMSEIGLDLVDDFPKPLTDDVVRAADVVVTMGCGDACPIYPRKRYLDWDLPDPFGQPIEQVRAIRDQIESHVHTLLGDILSPVPVKGAS